MRGEIDKYSWCDIGSSYLMNELSAAYLYAQLENVDKITERRVAIWNMYYTGLKSLEEKGLIELPSVPDDCKHNAHMFYIKLINSVDRNKVITTLKEKGVYSVFHYIPLHSSVAGKKYGIFVGEDEYTTKESERLVRLPMYYDLKDDEVEIVIEKVIEVMTRLDNR